MNGTRQACAALALLLAMPLLAPREARADSKPPCAGEIWHVLIERHDHYMGRQTSAGNFDPPPGRGFPYAVHLDYRVHGRYVSRPGPDGKFVWTHRTIDWNAHLVNDLPQCRTVTCEASGERDLGPMDGGGTPPGITTAEEALITKSIQCTTKTTGNCFGYFAANLQLPFPEIVPRDKLPVRTADEHGTRRSVWIEPLGDAHLEMWAHPPRIPANEGPKKDGDKDDPTAKITVVASCDGKPIVGENVEFRLNVEPNSGGHVHQGVPRPRGKLDGHDCGFDTGAAPQQQDPCVPPVKTDATGHAKVKFALPLTGNAQSTGYGSYKIGIAGDYRISARLASYPDAQASAMVMTRDPGLQPFEPAPGLTGDSSNTARHPHGSFATAPTYDAFRRLGADFKDQQERHNAALVTCHALAPGYAGPIPDPTWPVRTVDMNDIALTSGGIFDLDGTWKPSHYTHNKGEGGDFNRFGAGQDGPNPNFARLDCDGSSVRLQWWWAHLLLGLGEKYGSWDCKDLGLQAPCAAPAPITDATQPVPAGVNTWFPHRLHLHVEDRTP